MKSLRQSLIDYELPLLKAIADHRAVLLTAGDHTSIINQLVDTLLSPVATAIILDDLAPPESQALEFLLQNGGQVEGPRFSRQFGEIRSMGPARLEREQPWQNPANPAEGLWYRGLIFKSFQVTRQGSQEIVYIPDDLLPLLTPKMPPSQPSQPDVQIEAVAPPALILSSFNRLRENVFRILVYLQTTPIRIQQDETLTASDKQALTQAMLPPLHRYAALETELEFLLHLCRRAKLLTLAHSRLRPEREPTRSWLQATSTRQTTELQNTWRADPTWNDLWHVPELAPQPTGWENSPLLARSKILDYLAGLDISPGQWLSIDHFVTLVKQIDPDFQRPSGDYDTWYIQDRQGNFLMGFAHWDEVEGALIRYLLTFILPILGVVDLGSSGPATAPTRFCLTPAGQSFLTGRRVVDDGPPKTPWLRVDHNYMVRVPAQANLYDRFQVARFAWLASYDQHRVGYQITQASIKRALKNGVTPDQITAFLTRVTNNQTPLKVVEAIRNWGTRYATVALEPATLLHLKHEDLAAELRQHPGLGPLLGEALNATTILIPAKHVAQVKRFLIELGYLE
ncbi:MAG: helicase-associated domain-containing protein [Anaerolineales bacterium]|nr:helicase-associated domain-containing protein [Anaerolineales bacterium]